VAVVRVDRCPFLLLMAALISEFVIAWLEADKWRIS